MMPTTKTSALYLLLALLVATLAWAANTCQPGQASTSGVIQLVESSCIPNFDNVDSNGLLAMCGPAFKVDVNSKGHIYMTPLEQGQFKWAGPGPYQFPTPEYKNGYNWGVFQCKNMNATGVFDASNKKVASVMFYKDVKGPHSRLVVTGANNLTLVANHTDSYKAPGPNCTYNFKVVSGCVMGIRSNTAHTCPSGWHIKSSKFGIKYCAPCPLGSSSSGPGATQCTLCPAGYAGTKAGAKCSKCEGNYYSSKPGATRCDFCYVMDWTSHDNKGARNYTDGKSCKPCPADSWALDNNPRQCVACSNGVKCCRTNPSKDCPPCAKGFKSGSSTKPASFVLTSATPSACMKTDAAICTASVTVTVMPTCQVQFQTFTSVSDGPCYSKMTNYTSEVLRSKAAITDVNLFQYSGYGSSSVTSIKGPLVTFKLQAPPDSIRVGPKTCSFTYRSISEAGSLLGVPAARCPPGTPGCVYKGKPRLCPAGHYVQNNAGKANLCLPCPAGTYAPAENSATQCTPCPAGKYAYAYGSTGCGTCPIGTYSRKGAATCVECGNFIPAPGQVNNFNGFYTAKTGSATCTACPRNSDSQGSDSYPIKISRCLGRANGVMCCAAGDCSGQAVCPNPLVASKDNDAGILQVLSTQLSDSSCQASFLKCLSPRGLLAVRSRYSIRNLQLDPFNQPGCIQRIDTYYNVPALYGSYAAANRARFSYYEAGSQTSVIYEAVSDVSTGTVKIYFAPTAIASDPINPSTVKCSVTFKLIAGYAFDLKPPKDAKCPDGSKPVNRNGIVSCIACDTGSILKNGKCQQCPAGTYQPSFGGTSCIQCPAGTQSYSGSTTCSTCYFGSAPTSNRQACKDCRANTYALPGFLQCKACPAGLWAPAASAACGVSFPTK